MNKEVFLAILAGGVFGLLIAFGVWRANAYLNNKNSSTQTQKQNSQTTTASAVKIAIAKPENLQVMTSSPTTISGLAKPQSYVTVSGEETDEISVATQSGSFDVPIDLVGGANQLKISSFDPDQNSSEANILLVFSTEFQKDTNVNASDSAVQERLNKVIQTGTSYLGTVTDLPDDTIQIKNIDGAIQQIAVKPDTTSFLKTSTSTTKVVKKTDVAIGDFVIAMGIKNGLPAQAGNGVLNASRVLVTDQIGITKRQVFMGMVSNVTKNAFDLKTKVGQTIPVSPTTDVSVYKFQSGKQTVSKFSTLTNDNLIIVAGEFTDNKLTARTIWIISSK